MKLLNCTIDFYIYALIPRRGGASRFPLAKTRGHTFNRLRYYICRVLTLLYSIYRDVVFKVYANKTFYSASLYPGLSRPTENDVQPVNNIPVAKRNAWRGHTQPSIKVS